MLSLQKLENLGELPIINSPIPEDDATIALRGNNQVYTQLPKSSRRESVDN